MVTPSRILIAFALLVVAATAAPVGICLHAYSPEAPAEKIECFQFEKVERVGADYRFFPRADKSVIVTAYRFRGIILYNPNLAPTHPDFEKLLKLYEETARATPSTRPHLNPKILTMRSQVAGVAKQAESVAALPTITLADGSNLVGCTMSKIEDGFVSIRHQDGISKVSLKELDATEKKALNSTTDEWSLDDPSATPKDSTGRFAKIVFKNGLLLKKAKFKEVSNGKLVFIANGKSISVSADQFPGELTVLGAEVVKSLADGQRKESISQEPVKNPKNELGELSDSPFLKKAEQVKVASESAVAELEKKIESLTEEAKKSEQAFNDAGGEKALRKFSGRYFEVKVLRSLVDPSLKAMGGRDRNVYEVVLLADGSMAILVTELKLASGKIGGVDMSLRGTIDVSLVNGGKDTRDVYDEVPQLDEDNLPLVVRLHRAWQSQLTEANNAKSSIQQLEKRREQAVANLHVASELACLVRTPNLFVSPRLAAQGFSASIQDRKFKEVVEALKSGSLSRLEKALDHSSSFKIDESRYVGIDAFSVNDSRRIPTVEETRQLFVDLVGMDFKVELTCSDKQIVIQNEKRQRSAFQDRKLVCVPHPPSYMKKFSERKSGFERTARCSLNEIDNREILADKSGYVMEAEVFSCSIVAFCCSSRTGNSKGDEISLDSESDRLNEMLEQRIKKLRQDFDAGRIDDDEFTNKANSAQGDYTLQIRALLSRY